MDQVAREHIAAAAAVRQELGSGYDDVIAESLIEQIGAEIDKRLDARLDGRRRSRSSDIAELERRDALWKGAVVGAAGVGLPAVWMATASQDPGKGIVAIVLIVWALVVAGYALTRWARAQRRSDDSS